MKNLTLFILLFPLVAFAQKSTAFRIDSMPTGDVFLDNDSWTWHAGDDPEWAKPDFDDSQWEHINPIKQLPEIPQVSAAEICWFRIRLDMDSALFNKPFTFFYYVLGASEVYFNGKLLNKVGVVSKDPSIEKTFITPTGVLFNSTFSNTKENVIAVRYSLTRSNFYFPKFFFTRSSPISVDIDHAESAFNNVMQVVHGHLFYISMIGFFFCLAFTHFSFYYFLRHQKANLLFGLAMLTHSISLTTSYFSIDMIPVSFYMMLQIISNFALPVYHTLMILAIHSYLKQPLTKGFWLIVSLSTASVMFLYTDFNPGLEQCMYIFSICAATLYYVILLRKSNKMGNKKGLMIYYTGIICFISFAFYFIVVVLYWLHLSLPWFDYIFNISLFINFFSVTLGMSLTLARDFAQTDGSLQLKLKEVQQLSDEKQEILRGQNETLEQQVVERTEALNQSLAELKATQAQLIEKEQIASAAAVRLQELDTVKTRLYTNITHEFRTPLTVILGMAQQIKDAPQAFTTEGLGMIQRNGQNLLNLVNQMLDLSKLESGKLSLHYQRADVVTFMKYLVESFHSFAESKAVKIHFISDLEELTMDFDETYLQQIVSNLLTNAVKFTDKGGDIYVSLSIQSTTFSFKIRDTGKGISEANLPLIFDRFYQVDDTTTRHGEGTGIGLSLTRELVKLMEGTITVKSQLNKGTEFEVILPIHHIAEIKAEEKPLPVFKQASENVIEVEEHPLSCFVPRNDNGDISTEKPLVLIADDNADVRTYITSCLGTDYQLLIAKDGQECEDMAFDKIPDLIISDVMMPFKDGFEVCKTLKNDERTSHIPMIMLTAKADIDSKLQGLKYGADVYLMKPFVKEELLLRIKKLLELRQQLQQFYRSNAIYTEGSLTQPVEKPNPLANNANNSFVIKVRTLIEANLANADFDVEKLCHDLLLSPSQVHRKLTALTGLSTNSFIRYIRLSHAKDLLITNAHFSIAAVAYDSGFSDPAYFSRAFKQEIGETPQAWREQNLV